jgi:hypothetical protein
VNPVAFSRFGGGGGIVLVDGEDTNKLPHRRSPSRHRLQTSNTSLLELQPGLSGVSSSRSVVAYSARCNIPALSTSTRHFLSSGIQAVDAGAPQNKTTVGRENARKFCLGKTVRLTGDNSQGG